MFTDKSFKPIDDNQPYRHPDTGTNYPGNYPKGEIEGLVPVTETQKPADPALQITGFSIDENYTQVWHTRKKPKTPYEEARRIEYPNMGDQLDAIWKQINQDRLNGKNLIQEADDLLNEILAVKAKYPKDGR